MNRYKDHPALRYVKALYIVFPSLYIIGAMMNASFNPIDWTQQSRAFIPIVSVFISLVYSSAYWIMKETYSDYED